MAATIHAPTHKRILRCLLAYCRWQAAQERFREGRTQLQTLTSKLTDLAVLGISLDEKNLFDNEYLAHRSEASEESKHRRFVAILVHLISLLHAVCCGTLSGDLSTDSIQVRHRMYCLVRIPMAPSKSSVLSNICQAPPTDQHCVH